MSVDNANLFSKAKKAVEAKDYTGAVLFLYRWFFATNLPKSDQISLAKKVEKLEADGHVFRLVGVYNKKRRLLRTDLTIQFPGHRHDFILGGRVPDSLIEIFANQAGVKMTQSDAKDDDEDEVPAK